MYTPSGVRLGWVSVGIAPRIHDVLFLGLIEERGADLVSTRRLDLLNVHFDLFPVSTGSGVGIIRYEIILFILHVRDKSRLSPTLPMYIIELKHTIIYLIIINNII